MLLFPTLRGLAWPVPRIPEWDGVAQKSSSGKLLLYSFYSFPTWHWKLKFNYLKDSAADPYNPSTSSFINGCFLNRTSGWAAQGGAVLAQDTASPFAGGGFSLKITGTPQYAGANSTVQVPVTPGQTLYLSAWLKSDGIFANYAAIVFYNSAGSGLTSCIAGPTTSTAWAPFSIAGVAPATAAYATVFVGRIDTAGGTQSGWAADVSLSTQPGAQNVTGTSDLQALVGFFNQNGGPFGGVFWFNDPNDNTVPASSPQQIGVGDGATKSFQLLRTYGGFTEPVQAPQTWTIYLNGVAQSSGFTVSSTGLLTFTTAPASGVAISWSGTYFWNVHFEDAIDPEMWAYQLWRNKTCNLEMVKM